MGQGSSHMLPLQGPGQLLHHLACCFPPGVTEKEQDREKGMAATGLDRAGPVGKSTCKARDGTQQ